MPRIFFSSYDGCCANEAEGKLIRNFFLENGYELAQEPRVVQLRREGTVFSGSVEELERLRRQFDRHHCTRLPQLLEAGLFRLIQRQVDQAEFCQRIHEGIGEELRTTDNITTHLLHFLMNDPKFFHIIQEITGCGQVGCFMGRVYRMIPGCGHYDSWHDDAIEHHMIGLSINLSTEVYSGGIFQLRDRKSEQIVCQVANTGFGDASIFRIDPHLEHRVTSVEGTVPKTAFAGWFRSQPTYKSFLKQSLACEE